MATGFLVLSTGSYAGVTEVFCDDGDSIQDAVDNAEDGDRIRVSGTCYESVAITTDGITIFSTSRATIIPPVDGNAFTVSFSNHVQIFGFNILGGRNGIRIFNGSSASVRNNRILESTATGIHIRGSNANVRRNTLHSTSGNFSQIFVDSGSSADVALNTITASSGSGIEATHASFAFVVRNNVSGVPFGGLAVTQNSVMQLFESNTVNSPGGTPIFCGATGSLTVHTAQNTTGAVLFVAGCEVVNFGTDPFP